MATGFMLMRNSIVFLGLAVWAGVALADVALIGVIGDKAAVLAVDGGNPKAVKVGQTWNGITVLEVRKGQTTIEADGKKRVLVIGQHYRGVPPPPPAAPGAKQVAVAATTKSSSDRQSVVLPADGAGHFFSMGQINGISVHFLVDTGATLIALPGGEAARIGIDYRKGKRGLSNTANGTVAVYEIKLDTVKLGEIELNNVDALVIEEGLSVVLLGMSFLNRVEMQRSGDSMTLTKRF
jgi:aspartyl protease family protein